MRSAIWSCSCCVLMAGPLVLASTCRAHCREEAVVSEQVPSVQTCQARFNCQLCFGQQAYVGWCTGPRQQVALVPPEAKGPGVDTRTFEAAAQALQHSRTRRGLSSVTLSCAGPLPLQLLPTSHAWHLQGGLT